MVRDIPAGGGKTANLFLQCRKRAGKNSGFVGNFPQGERKRLPVHGTFNTAASVVKSGISFPFCISVYTVKYSEKKTFLCADGFHTTRILQLIFSGGGREGVGRPGPHPPHSFSQKSSLIDFPVFFSSACTGT